MKSPDNSRGLGAALSKVGGFVAGLPRIAVVAAALALGGGGYALQHTNIGVTQQEFETLYSGEDECTDFISQAKSEMGSGSGYGDNQIPEPYGDIWTITGYCKAGWQYFDSSRNPTSTAAIAAGTPQLEVHNAWLASGAKYDDGIASMGGKLFVAVTPKLGNVGDWITVYLSNGKSLECIVADQKGADADNEYGHSGGHSVVEFEVEPRAYQAHGNPGNGYHTELAGARTTSWTNHGRGINMGGLGGAVGGNMNSMSGMKSSQAASAFADCESSPKYDNSTLVSAYISLSYSQRRVQADSEPSTALYQEVCEATMPDDVTAPYHYHSCDRGVASAIIWTGADINFPRFGCNQDGINYCNGSSLWQAVAGPITIDGGDEWAQANGLEPGDIGITPQDHILVYVGHEAVEEGYEKFIKGNNGQTPGTGGDIGEPTSTAAFVSASAHTRGENISDVTDSRPYYFFRYVGDYPDKDKFADVGSAASLQGASSRGTSCDCNECPPEGAKTPSTAAEVMAQVAEHIADDDAHGYSQPNRLGDGSSETIQVNGESVTIHGGDYDCSSMMSMCAIAAGLITEDQVFWTGSEDEILTGAGFTKMAFSPDAAQRGDILLMDGHTGMCIGDGMQADAHGSETGGTDGATADQTGSEISRVPLSSAWLTIYRPPGQSASSSKVNQAAKDCDCGGEWDDFESSAAGDTDAMMQENAKKVWQVFSAYGLEDNAIAGVLSNMEAECGIDPTTIEAIYDSPYAMNGKKAPMRGTDEQSLKNLADWTEGGMYAAYQRGGPSLNWAFYNGGPDGRHYAGIGLGSWTGYDQVHDVYGKAAAIGTDWWSIDFQIAYLLACDSNANPPGEAFWKQYSAKVKGMSPTDCAYWFYGTYEMPGFCGPAYYVPLHTQHADKWAQAMKGWSRDDSYANSVLSMASKLSASASLDGLATAADNCPSLQQKAAEVARDAGKPSDKGKGIVDKAKSMVGADYAKDGYTDGGSPDKSSFSSAGLVDWALGLPSGTSTVESLYKQVSAADKLKTKVSEFSPGDLVFYDRKGQHPGHVAIYVGNNKVVSANGSKWGVCEQDVLFIGKPIGAGTYV